MNSIDQNSKESTWLATVKKQVSSLSFGVVAIAVHNGSVVLVECTEKLRIQSSTTCARETRELASSR